MAGYEKIGAARFTIEFVEGVEQVRIRAARSWPVLAFLVVWLTGWTIGGIAAIGQLVAHFDLFLLAWLAGWALGWVFAAGTILWQLAGVQVVRVIRGDLEIGIGIGPLLRRRLYKGSDIRGLRANALGLSPLRFARSAGSPFSRMSGTVKFHYGPRTVYFATGLDEAEAEMVVDHLRRRLPLGASQ